MADVQYASNGKGNLGVTLGAIGTGLGVMAGAGGLAGVLGLQPNSDPENRPVTRYEMGLIQENTLLKANQYTDNRANGLQAQISQQCVWNATQEGLIRDQQRQLMQLYSITKFVVPATSLMTSTGAMTETPA